MKILFLTHKFNPDIGGIESVSEMLANEFSRQGNTVRVLTWTDREGVKRFDYTIIRRPHLRQIIKEMKWADIIFENNPCLRLSWPNLLIRKPIVVALHTWLKNIRREVGVQERLKLVWLKKANKVIACSEALRKATFPSAITIGNPYDNQLFSLDATVSRSKDYIFLGRLVSDKGVQVALKALRLAIDLEPQLFANSNFTVIGDGPELQVLKSLVIELHLQNRVFFEGSKTGESLVAELNQHKYLIVPSLWQEPFGIVVLEGMACGCIPIVSESGGLPDAVGAAGVLFECGKAESLAHRMIHLKKTPTYENNLHAAAQEHLLNHHRENVAKQYLKVLKSVDEKGTSRLYPRHENNF